MITPTLLRQRAWLALWAALIVLLAACGGPAVPLNGTVTDAYTGKPIPGASVSLGNNTLVADANGQFSVTRWSAQDTLQVSANGYEPASITLASRPDLAKPTPPAATLDATIRPNTLIGVITDGYTSQPVAGALVKVSDTISATTDANGNYTLNGVPEEFKLTVSATDYEPTEGNISRLTSFSTPLRPTVLNGIVTDRYTKQPVVGATVSAGAATTVTGADGRYRLSDVPLDAQVQVKAKGYADLTQVPSRSTTLDLVLRPNILSGTLADATTGAPIKNATVIARSKLDTIATARVRIDSSPDGRFTLENMPEQGYLQVLAPGYRRATLEIKEGSVPTTIKLEPFEARGLYITSAMAASMERVNQYFDVIDKTELNAIVIDLKSDLRDDLGLIYYDSQVPIVKELGTARDIMPIREILAEARKRGIYTIARVHIFSHDNVLADAKPEWAAKDRTTGEVFADYPGPNIRYAWLDPWNQNVWNYNIQLSVEAALMGFDEINYDYIRFPSLEFDAEDKNRLQLSRENSTPEERYANIGAVLERSQQAIHEAGAFLSVDVFGMTTFGPVELIGQNLTVMAEHTDYIMPMVYPSHYNLGEFGFDNPAKFPYEVISKSMQNGLKQVEGKRALLRPWLQDFTLTWVPRSQIVEYGAAEVRAQIRAANELSGIAGWVLYDSANTYTEEALEPEQR